MSKLGYNSQYFVIKKKKQIWNKETLKGIYTKHIYKNETPEYKKKIP